MKIRLQQVLDIYDYASDAFHDDVTRLNIARDGMPGIGSNRKWCGLTIHYHLALIDSERTPRIDIFTDRWSLTTGRVLFTSARRDECVEVEGDEEAAASDIMRALMMIPAGPRPIPAL